MMSKNTVTAAQIKEIMALSQVEVQTVLGKCTVVTCQLPNGFIIVESSACVDPANYDEKMGAEICLQRIENKVWELEGYKLQAQFAEEEGYSTEDLAEMGAEFGFDVALTLLKEGEKVKRKHWGGYWFIPYNVRLEAERDNMNPMIVACLKDDNGYAPAQAYQEDLLANDWMVVK